MTSPRWHAGPDVLAAYAGNRLDDVGQAAVETHLTRCPTCRADATPLVPPTDLEPVWEGVAVAIANATPWPLRVLRRLGLRDTDLVLLRASSDLVVPFAVALMSAVTFTIIAGQVSPARQQLLYLLVAPLLPALLVAGAYDSTDPLRELAEATSLSKLRVALLRTALAAAGALPLALLMGLVPGIGLGIGLWLLPAIAVSVATLALLTWFVAPVTLAVVTAAWASVVVVLGATGNVAAASTALGQACFAAAAVVAALVLARRLGLGEGARS